MGRTTRDTLLGWCLDKPGAVEDYPFGDDVAVIKVGGKMFALVSMTDDPPTISLKCDPDWAEALRAEHNAVAPGYHLNKRHWNTVTVDASMAHADLTELIDHSHDLVVSGLPKRVRENL